MFTELSPAFMISGSTESMMILDASDSEEGSALILPIGL